ncbi:pectinesterase family protein [Pedobacter sp. SYP-B3415]|uniref:pectinesterase family protein n=1 Tax=Pedobacter sp. SYP-B3415 TaxID=2496641 RepID=UPI00101D511F|nr:pectinesterase family protein [Pedobacter sp. SYP-B3415]
MKNARWLIFGLILMTVHAIGQNKTSKSYPVKLTVATDGSGDYRSINEALQAFRGYSPAPLTLFIKNGTYQEKVIVPHWLCNLTITGESRDQTIIAYNDHAGKSWPADRSDRYRKVMGTFDTYTMLILGNDVRIEGLTIQNAAGRVGQAIALHVEGDRFSIDSCAILGNQDTLFTGNDSSRQLYTNCLITGTTDFVFGPATALFLNCEVRSLADSYITAASTRAAGKFGYVFLGCRFTAAEGVGKVWLGRPWRANARVVVIRSELGGHIRPEGWHNWDDPENEKTAFYAEYKNEGPGSGRQQRVAWSLTLSRKEAAGYSPLHVLGDWAEPFVRH